MPAYLWGYELMGDSHAVRLGERLGYPLEGRFPRRIGLARSGARVLHLLQEVVSAAEVPERAIIIIGSNDLRNGTSIRKMKAAFYSLIRELLRRGCRDVIVVEVFPAPRLTETIASRMRLNSYNRWLRGWERGKSTFLFPLLYCGF
ncbi:uncharacterized protein LOC124173334 [Ischnura elegans]|uniref:uncharacterized protein LOC124173334 n=1 Tax=Ischnura elegans TaxID=197161 RepID=UPI001ED89D6F|nr:uncharacterized protein LOC124173334 [Ischnura elegans]